MAPAGIGVGWDGYVSPDDPAPPGGLPLYGTVYLGCVFHDENYPDHTGVDFPAGQGTPVYTTLAGRVVWADFNGPWGNLVVVENGGYQVYLAHLDSLTVSPGQMISRSEAVGTVGSTGRSTGPHLHYGVKRRTDGGRIARSDTAPTRQAPSAACPRSF